MPRRPVVLVTSDRLHDPRNHYLFARGLSRAGLPVIEAGQPPANADMRGLVPVMVLPQRGTRFARMLSGPLTMRRVLKLRPSLVQINSLDLLPWAVVGRRLARIPVIYDSREDYSAFILIKEWLPRRIRPILARFIGTLEPWLASRLDATLAPDDGTASLFAGRGIRVVCIHNFPWKDVPPSPALGRAPEFDVIYHGTVSGYHADRILDAARRLAIRGLRLRWCLAIRDYGLQERVRLEGRIRREGLSQAFSVRYDVPFEEIPGLLARSRVGFIPLPDELKFRRNLPRKLFEFMLSGRPAVVSDLPPVRRLVEDARCCLLVNPGDAEGYADALEHLLGDTLLAEEMGARGRELVLRSLNAERELGPYIALCRQLITRDENVD